MLRNMQNTGEYIAMSKNNEISEDDVIEIAKEIENTHGIAIFRNYVNCEDNQGYSVNDMIWLGKFDNPKLELAALFHEFGHTQSKFLRGYSISTMTSECLAWELAANIAFEFGYVWDQNGEELKYARECLETYRKNDDNWR